MAEEQDSFANRIKGAVNLTQDNIPLVKEPERLNTSQGQRIKELDIPERFLQDIPLQENNANIFFNISVLQQKRQT